VINGPQFKIDVQDKSWTPDEIDVQDKSWTPDEIDVQDKSWTLDDWEIVSLISKTSVVHFIYLLFLSCWLPKK
jgi:hypothetical protein